MKVGDKVRVLCCDEHAAISPWYVQSIVNGLVYVVESVDDSIPLRLFEWQVELIEEG